jgi:hypothetical protein
VHEVAVEVPQDLHLDVAHLGQVLLEEDDRTAECGERLAARLAQRHVHLGFAVDHAHAAAATAVCSLQDRGAVLAEEVRRSRKRSRLVLGQFQAGHRGDAQLASTIAPRNLVTQEPDCTRTRPEEGDPRGAALLRELGVLRQESVAGVDRVHLGTFGDLQDLVDAEVGSNRSLALAHHVGLVRLVPVLVGGVLLAEDRNGPDPELRAGTEDADGDLATVCAHHLLELHRIPPALRVTVGQNQVQGET